MEEQSSLGLVAVLVGVIGGIVAIVNVTFIAGWALGKMRSSVDSAHHRIDDLEEHLCNSLKETLRESWRFCPLASKDGAQKEVS